MDTLDAICERLLQMSNAVGVWLVDEQGATLARAGEPAVDVELLMPASSRLRADGELFERTQLANVYVALVAGGAVLAVVFDSRSSLGLVRLRVLKAKQDLARALDRGPSGGSGAPATRDVD